MHTKSQKQDRESAVDFIIKKILEGERKLDKLKRQASHMFHCSSLIKNPEILERFPKNKLTKEIQLLLIKKPTRTLSGVTPIAVMIKPQGSCSYNCIYCPMPDLAAKSYTGFEPAALRARQYGFDPYMQALSRVEQFEGGGHSTDKCEVIVMGGTFLQMNPTYKKSFIKGIYDGLNGFKSQSLASAMKHNETAKHRAIGLTIETRPDVCTKYINEMLSYGATRVELGVQHPDDKIYALVQRGHKVKDVTDSTKKLKDSAFKVLYHIMPGLPGSSPKKDIKFVKKLFADENFRPDMLKIYPTLVVGGTKLERMAKSGKYIPYSAEEAADIISEFYRYIPNYVRVMRIQRDIPSPKIQSGVKKSNLRELVEAKIREKKIIPNEIRYREVGLQKRKLDLSDFELKITEYKANGGKEFFISYENEGILAGFIRLRFPKNSSALIRELHVYGAEVPLDGEGKVQHMGFGNNLLKKAEEISQDNNKDEILIISGVGVREYYRKKGYTLSKTYMRKKLPLH
ncbi:MAG: tRNA uridine(34) 5-carboxymethylaminomethyl modification radical SAM/GNAT enzyme Elp3 [Candidatus Micrarchaeota archaeon]